MRTKEEPLTKSALTEVDHKAGRTNAYECIQVGEGAIVRQTPSREVILTTWEYPIPEPRIGRLVVETRG